MADPLRPPEPERGAGFDLNRPTIVALLYLAGCVLGGLPALAGIVLAHIWRAEPGAAWEEAHFQYLVRTFWIALGFACAGVLLIWAGIGLLILFAVPLWFAVRSIAVLVRAQRHEAMPDPKGWLI
jgi:uncharacterized membrane protein